MTTKTFNAGADIAAHRLVKFSDTEKTVVAATAGTDVILGVTDDVDVKEGNVADVHLAGVHKAQAGGTIAQGDKLTATADGKAVKAEEGNNTIGIALEDATEDEYFEVLLK